MRPAVAGAVWRAALVQNRARTLLAVVAIALGVALGYAVRLINDAAVNELKLSVQTLSGDADLEVRGPRDGFAEAIYGELAQRPEVAVASPVVEVEAKLAGRDGALRIVGLDVFRAAAVQPGLVPMADERFAVLRPDRVFLSPAAARELRVGPGDTLAVQVGLATVDLHVAGLLPSGDRQRFAVMDIAGAQWLLARLGLLTRIDLRLAQGVDVARFRARLEQELPPGLAVDRPETRVAATERMSRSYRVNLDVLALVALFTGGLLVYSTQALAIVRRRPQLALLRVLGMTRAQLVRLLVAESAAIGVAGAVLGLVVGHLLAVVLLTWVGADLGSGQFAGVSARPEFDPLTMALFLGLGVLAAVSGSFGPAREAARAEPGPALKAGDEHRVFEKRSPWPGLAALGLAAGIVWLPPVDGLPLFGYAAIALMLVGTLLLLPELTRWLVARAPSPRTVPLRLAVAQLRVAPGQVAVSLATIVAAVSLIVSMAIMVASFRVSLERWLDRSLPADVYLRAANSGDSAFLDADLQARIAALPVVREIEFGREVQVLLDPQRPPITLLARQLDLQKPGERLALVDDGADAVAAIAVASGAPPPAWISEAVADLYGLAPGARLALPLGGRMVDFTIAGVYRDYVRQQGSVAIERTRYVDLTGDATVTSGGIWVVPGTAAEALVTAIRTQVPGGDRLEVGLPGAIRAASLAIFDRTFAVTYALELAAVAIGLAGLSSAFGALVLARRREFGVLRHVGVTRGQIAVMLATEGGLVTAIGLLAGVTLGWLMSLVLVHVVNRQSFHWGMELALPWGSLAALVAVILGLATLTAVASGRQAMGRDVVRAVKEDW